VEVNYSPEENGWRFFRFRDDKKHGNHSKVVRKVVESIRDGVERDEVNRAIHITFDYPGLIFFWIFSCGYGSDSLPSVSSFSS